jgi:hypothetical protein
MARSILRSVPLSAWSVQRFGLSPTKLRYRAANQGAPRVLCVSIPKAGTHLLERALCLHPRLYRKLLPTVSDENIARWGGLDGLLSRVHPGQIVASHLRFRDVYPGIIDARSVRAIFLTRDPRDIVVSQVHYVAKRVDHRHHEVFSAIPALNQRLKVAIEGDPAHHVVPLAEKLDAFAGWLDVALVVRFEDLIGPQGGGDAERQRETLRSIYRFLEMPIADGMLDSIGDALFSSASPTFRSGGVGGWRDAFDPGTVDLFDAEVGDRLRPYGYGSSDVDDRPGHPHGI